MQLLVNRLPFYSICKSAKDKITSRKKRKFQFKMVWPPTKVKHLTVIWKLKIINLQMMVRCSGHIPPGGGPREDPGHTGGIMSFGWAGNTFGFPLE